MKFIKYSTKNLLVVIVCFVLGACSNENLFELEQIETRNKQVTRTVAMNFIGGVTSFDYQSLGGRGETKNTSSSWSDGDKIYISFYNDNNIVLGEAVYYSSIGWSVKYDGDLTIGTNIKCEVRYFLNASSSSASMVSLNYNTEIYEDLNGTYTYKDNYLTVQASLSPKTGRIRFTGTPGTELYVTGFSFYTAFYPTTNKFSSSNEMITSIVSLEGSTPYIYAAFADSDRNIGLISSDFAYTRTCPNEVLMKGESGYMAIPTQSSHDDWRSGLYVRVSGVEFKMIPVAGFSGGFYMISETEVTNRLYNAVTSSTEYASNEYPVSASYDLFSSFIIELSNTTNLKFCFPSKDQWMYAAKGGNKSQNYFYSGSNNPAMVAWYLRNSGGKVHEVKKLAPNELGIYDMSGNVDEWTSTRSPYSSNKYCVCGGHYASDLWNISTMDFGTSYKYNNHGLRLALTL